MKKWYFVSLLWVGFLTMMYVPSCVAAAALSLDEAKKMFGAAYPGVPVDSLSLSPIDGVFEIISGGRIAYYYPPKDILIVGNLIQKGLNITNQRMTALQTEKVKSIPLDKAVKIGSGKHTVIEFTDPDCPYCRTAAEYMLSRTDVTKYLFFLPLTAIHPQAEVKAKYVLDAEDKAKAYQEVMSGALDKKDWSQYKPSEAANTRLSEQTAIAGKLGINSTPTFWIDGQYVGGADIRMFNQILGEQVKDHMEKSEGK
jgi:thiol:disulfide interchange protein DsbC